MKQIKKGISNLLTAELESSHLLEAKYDVGEQELFITFKGNATYCYFDVPAEIFCRLVVAESVGKYFNSNVKKFKFKKL